MIGRMHPIPLILCAWLVIGVVLVGVGLLLRRGFRSPPEGIEGWMLTFWLGCVSVIFALQLWHFVLPVDHRATLAIAGVSLLGYALNLRVTSQAIRRAMRYYLPPLLACGAAAYWLADRALQVIGNGDSGLYHLPTVRWFAAYPAVIGLGNLYVAYAFNQSYFLYVAALDVGPIAHRSSFVANGVFVLAGFAQSVFCLFRMVRWRRPASPQDLFYALILTPVAALGFNFNLANPSPDILVYVLSIVISGHLLALGHPREPRPERDFDMLALALLAFGGVATKLSIAGLAGAALLIGAALWLYRERPPQRRIVGMFLTLSALASFSIVPWVVRSILFSGYPFFPNMSFGMPVEWRVSVTPTPGSTQGLAVNWLMFGIPWWKSLTLSQWPWLKTVLKSSGWVEFDGALLAVALGATALALTVWLGRLFLRSPRGTASWIVTLPGFASLVFVYSMSPLERYIGATLWIVATLGVVALIDTIIGARNMVPRLLAATASIWFAAVPFRAPDAALRDIKEFPLFSPPRFGPLRLATGLTVNDSSLGWGMCWDAPLPCTPTPNQALRLRRPGDLSSGFVIDPAFASRNQDHP